MKMVLLTRFDIVVRGDYWGEGRFARHAPEGKFPFAVAFRLSDGTEPYDTPPTTQLPGFAFCAAPSPDGNKVAAACDDKNVYLFELEVTDQ